MSIQSQASLLIVIGALGWLHSCGTRSYLTERLNSPLTLHSANPVVAQPRNFSFALIGDLHVGGQNTSRLERIISLAAREGDEFMILLGDTIDKGEEEDFIRVKTVFDQSGFKNSVFYAIGNHDVFENGWAHYYKYFGPVHYSFRAGYSKFIVLDTADATVGEEQTEWLRAELAEPAEHIFLASHYLPAIPGIQTYLKMSNDHEAVGLMKLASDFGVRAWLGAHYHSFVVGRIEGVDYVVAGGGGGRRMDPVHSFFFAQVTVKGSSVSYRLNPVD